MHSAWTAIDSIARRSRHLASTHEIATPWGGDGNWIDSLNQLQRDFRFELILPCNDQAAIAIREHRDRIVDFDSYYVLDDDTFEIVNSKVNSAALAKSVDVPVPSGLHLHDARQAEVAVQALGLPVVLKPDSSFLSNKLDRKQEVVIANTRSQLEATLSKMLERSERVLAQEFFSGVGTGVEFLSKDGELLTTFQHLRLHEPPGGGGSSYRKSIDLHPDMLDATARMVRKLNYTGVGMVEFLWDRPTDQWRFVEINGRFWGSLPLAVASGADFPADLYKMLCNGTVPEVSTFRENVHCRNLTSDKNWCSDFLRSKNVSVATKVTRFVSGMTGALGRAVVGKECVDTFSLDDPKPFFAECQRLVKEVMAGAGRKTRLRMMSTKWARSRNRAKLLDRLAGCNSVMFVCKGNICRSPFAHHYAKSKLRPSVRVTSSGYFPKSGRPSPKEASVAASRFGIDLESHRSVLLTQELVDQTDVVIVFDYENYERLRTDMPDSMNKVFMLNHAVSGANIQIADPYGRSVEGFEKTYRQIISAVDAIAENATNGATASQRNAVVGGADA